MALFGWGSPPKDKVTHNKGTLTYSFGMRAVKSLQVAGRPHHGGVPHLLEHVDIRLALFLSPLLIVEVDAWSIEIEVGGNERHSPIDEEEWGVPHGAVHACP